MAGGIVSSDEYIAFNKIPYGYYPQSSNGWAPEIRAKKSAVANNMGLTPEKIVAGNTICGVTGTAIKGYKNTIVHTNGVDTIFDVGFTPNIVYMLRSSYNIEILYSKKTGVFNQYSSSHVSPAADTSISGSIVTIDSTYTSDTFTVLAI